MFKFRARPRSPGSVPAGQAAFACGRAPHFANENPKGRSEKAAAARPRASPAAHMQQTKTDVNGPRRRRTPPFAQARS